MRVPRSRSATCARYGNGAHTAQPGGFALTRSSSSAATEVRLPCIFQLPATSRTRAMPLNFTVISPRSFQIQRESNEETSNRRGDGQRARVRRARARAAEGAHQSRERISEQPYADRRSARQARAETESPVRRADGAARERARRARACAAS